MARNGSIIANGTTYKGGACSLTLSWNVDSQSVETNASNVAWTATFRTENAIQLDITKLNVWFNGQLSSLPATKIDVAANTDTVIFNGTTEVAHESSDYQSLSYQFKFYFRGLDTWNSGGTDYTMTPLSASGSDVIDYIVRSAYIKSLSSISITDEDTLTLEYSNPAGEYTESLQAGMSLTTTDSNMAVPYRNLSKTGTSYTFNFTASELSNLYKVLDDGATSARLRLFLKSIVPIGGGNAVEVATDNRDITLTFIYYKPTLNVQLKATDSTTLNATGDERVFINGVSEVYYNLNPSVKKGAKQDAIWIGNGGDDKYTASGTFTNVTTNYFSAYLRDNRGYQVSQEIKLGEGDWTSYRWIDYFPLTVKVHQGLLAADGKLAVTLTGKFFNGDFGEKSNSFKYQYNIRKTTSSTDSWSSIISVSPTQMTIDNDGNYSYTFTIPGLDYTARYALTVDAIDEIMSEMAETTTVIGAIPVFDWSKDDFNFNVPVNFSDGFTVPLSALKQLWNGQFQMESSSVSINLIEKISDQPNGIVLIFTPYNSTTGLAVDEKLQSFFISKKTVQVMGSKMHTFYLMDGANFGTVGAKSLYIADSRITGYANNNLSGTGTSGIKYDNTKFVLRWILGV